MSSPGSRIIHPPIRYGGIAARYRPGARKNFSPPPGTEWLPYPTHPMYPPSVGEQCANIPSPPMAELIRISAPEGTRYGHQFLPGALRMWPKPAPSAEVSLVDDANGPPRRRKNHTT